jgi:hypothetical protein
VFCKYTFYLDHKPVTTPVVHGKNVNPEFNFKHHHTVECVTTNILKYFKGDCLKVQVYGYPDLEQKKGGEMQAASKTNKNKSMNSTNSSGLKDESTELTMD